ncbi:PucR family transcriptional regulator [Agathobaculum sp. Marseille-P7918]|uniref:PucR family transcriptional regulator n=1 Tax=Agathobaculum sp. Marseille-P7918 TaxID=2479843 RepID=UPI0013DE0480|nr:PucR family transcriptional regulator [Agathobaculum sp. Marseille-P7918]
MVLTLEQFSAQSECCKMTCVAGFRGLQREVNSFSIVDTPEIISWLRGGELVVDAGFITSKHPEMQKTLVAELNRRGCAGLGIKLHRYYDAIPAAFIEAGNELDFPVFALPYEVRFCDLAYEIHKQVFEQRLTETQRLCEVYSKLVHTFSTHQDLNRTLYDVSRILNNPVLLANAGGELLAMENLVDNPDHLAEFFQLSFGKPLFHAERMQEIEQCWRQKLRTHRMTLTVQGRTLAVVLAAIRTGEQLWGFFVVPECMQPLGKEQYHILESICPLLALHFAWNHLSHNEPQEETSEFVNKVLLSSTTPLESIQTLCTVNGFDYTRKRVCINVTLEHFENLTFSRRNVLRDLLQSECDRLAEQQGYLCYCTSFRSCVTIFLLAAPQTNSRTLSADAQQIAQALAALLLQYEAPVRIGISDCSTEPEKISVAFSQTLSCIQMGSRLAPDERLYTFDEYQIYYLLSTTMSESDIRALYEETIAPLHRFDLENQCNYVNALESYVKNRFNVSKTATEIHVHRNTLLYQLDKIREILSLDMDDYENMLKLQMGIHAMRLLEHPELHAAEPDRA